MADRALDRLYQEVLAEPASLTDFARLKLRKAPPSSIFVGAGDSYAAALAGFYASGGNHIALDPYTLASSPALAKGAEVYFISASGRTASSVAAAGRVRGVAKRTTSVTAVVQSKLAQATDSVIRLPMSYEPRTPGLLSFGLSLLAVIKLAGRSVGCDFYRVLRASESESHSISFARETTYFLGNSLAHPVAVYAAAKTREILGSKAHAEMLEEFGHMELLSLAKRDSVNALASFDPKNLAERLARILREQGYDSHVVGVRGKTAVESLFGVVFALQLAVVKEAKRRGLKRASFLDIGGRLGASDALIY